MSNTYKDLIHTNFPESLDVFLEKENILSTDSALLEQYEEAIRVGNFASANEIFLQIADGNKKILTSNTMLRWRDGLLALERYFNDNVLSYLQGKQSEWDSIVPELRYIGIFSEGLQYNRYNIVWFKDNVDWNLYMCNISESIGILPSEMDTWVQVTEQGIKQVSSSYSNIVNEWKETIGYGGSSIVGHINKVWHNENGLLYTEPSIDVRWNEMLNRETLLREYVKP